MPALLPGGCENGQGFDKKGPAKGEGAGPEVLVEASCVASIYISSSCRPVCNCDRLTHAADDKSEQQYGNVGTFETQIRYISACARDCSCSYSMLLFSWSKVGVDTADAKVASTR